MAKNTVCIWYDKDAEAAARFYTATFPDSRMGAVHRAPSDYPSGKKGDVLTVDFSVAGIPCMGLNGGPTFKQTEAFSFQISTERSGRDGPLLERHRREWRPGKRVRLVQGPMGGVVADHAARADRGAGRGWAGSEASVRCDDDDEEDRRCDDREGAAGVVNQASNQIRETTGGSSGALRV